jgi:hypothetical protein
MLFKGPNTFIIYINGAQQAKGHRVSFYVAGKGGVKKHRVRMEGDFPSSSFAGGSMFKFFIILATFAPLTTNSIPSRPDALLV